MSLIWLWLLHLATHGQSLPRSCFTRWLVYLFIYIWDSNRLIKGLNQTANSLELGIFCQQSSINSCTENKRLPPKQRLDEAICEECEKNSFDVVRCFWWGEGYGWTIRRAFSFFRSTHPSASLSFFHPFIEAVLHIWRYHYGKPKLVRRTGAIFQNMSFQNYERNNF